MDDNLEVPDNHKNVALYSEVPVSINGHQRNQELQPLKSQVAGHSAANGASSLGMLLHPKGYVIKPVENKVQGENEIRFYRYLQSASDPFSLELREYVPTFYETTSVMLGGKAILCIVLENVTDGMCEPCVMDVKIGKQTWEPSASEEKKRIEKSKYVKSKQECGFCIPGMQFYDITNSQLVKYGKEYGKKLDKNGIKDALKLFLNWKSAVSRPLILLFLCKLWNILKWFQTQQKFLFYSSSILFVYDAHLLRHSGTAKPNSDKLTNIQVSNMPTPKNTIALVKEDVCEKITSPHLPASSFEVQLNTWKEDCLHMSDNLENTVSCGAGGCPKKWADVKMIDFAHTIISKECNSDSNYVEGLQNLVRMFEILLEEMY